MEVFFYTILFIFWILFWSFSSVIIYRFKSWEKWIMNWRSHCPKCNHTLWALELIPIISWFKNLWKCKYCKAKISSIYPFLEVTMGILFVLIWYYLIDFNLIIEFNISEIIKLWFWLLIWFITVVYSFYDILFLEIHDWIMWTWIIIALLWVILQSTWVINIISFLSINNISSLTSINIFLSILLLIISIWLMYIIMLKELDLKYDFLILFLIWTSIYLFSYLDPTLSILSYPAINALIWIYIIFAFFFLQIAVSWWAWMWWWDLRIAILIWLLLGYSFSIEWLFATYIAWSIIWVSAIIISKFKNWFKTTFNTQIPFWPFLAIWFFVALFIQKPLIEIINLYL